MGKKAQTGEKRKKVFMLIKVLKKLKHAETSRKNLKVSLIPYYLKNAKILITRVFFLKQQYHRLGFCSVAIETYGFCNRKCEFCFNHDRFPKREQGIMKQQTFEKVIDELSQLKYCGWITPVFYGEPLLDKRLPELIKYTKRKIPNCYIHIDTNGDFLDEELFTRLIKKGADRFFITNYDDEEKPRLTSLAKKYPLHIILRNYKDFKKLDRAGEIFKRNSILNIPCLRPSAELVINWKGDVLLCCQDFYAKYCMGSIHDNSLLNIWNNKKFTTYRNKLRLGQRSSIRICKHCDCQDGISWLSGFGFSFWTF
jgi:cyclic pyranopterin phosphate synthase